MEIASKCATTAVNAIHVRGDYLFYGRGNRLHVKNVLNSKSASVVVSKFWNVHGITSMVDTTSLIVTVFVRGSRFLAVFELRASDDQLLTLNRIREDFNFGDWVLEFRPRGHRQLVVVLMNNRTVLYDWFERKEAFRVECPVRCIIYSAHILSPQLCGENLGREDFVTIASGTVFKEVIIWTFDASHENTTAKVSQRLTGHDGVIFAIHFDSSSGKLATASDDRSVRLWTLTECLAGADTSQVACEQFKFDKVLYGHEARIWCLTISENKVISCGENGNICLWNAITGDLVHKETGFSSLWTLELDEKRKRLHFGHGDGRLSCRQFTELVEDVQSRTRSFEASFPKAIAFVRSQSSPLLIVVDNLGNITAEERTSEKPLIKLQLSDFADYAVMCVDVRTILLGNKAGKLVKLKLSDNCSNLDVLSEVNAHRGKVFSLFRASKSKSGSKFVSCGPQGELKLWEDRDTELTSFSTFELPPCRHRWATCGLFVDRVLVIGDRCGAVMAFDLNGRSPRDYYRLHGVESGVTDIVQVPRTGKILSSGRDGRVIEYDLSEKMKVLRVFRQFTDMNWICRLFLGDGDVQSVLGFRSNKFEVVNCSSGDSSWSVECGGGHRCWDYEALDRGDGAGQVEHFVYAKQANVVWCTRSKGSNLIDSVKSVTAQQVHCVSFFDESDRFFATGSEDNLIRIHRINSNQEFEHLDTLYGHISSVRTLATLRISANTWLLVTAGGRSQLMVWKVRAVEGERAGSQLTIEQCASHFVWTLDGKHRKPWTEKNGTVAEDPQIRYNSVSLVKSTGSDDDFNFTVIGCCSDGRVRIFTFKLFSNGSSSLEPLTELFAADYSVISSWQRSDLLICGPNSGKIKFFKFSVDHEAWNLNSNCSMPPLTSVNGQKRERQLDGDNLVRFALMDNAPCFEHQNGITAMDGLRWSGNKWLIVTGGDDCALNLCLFSDNDGTTGDGGLDTIYSRRPSCHSTAITGIKILKRLRNDLEEVSIVTASIDQRIKIWRLQIFGNLILKELKCDFSCVSDISCIDCDSDSGALIVCGQGLELFKLK